VQAWESRRDAPPIRRRRINKSPATPFRPQPARISTPLGKFGARVAHKVAVASHIATTAGVPVAAATVTHQDGPTAEQRRHWTRVAAEARVSATDPVPAASASRWAARVLSQKCGASPAPMSADRVVTNSWRKLEELEEIETPNGVSVSYQTPMEQEPESSAQHYENDHVLDNGSVSSDGGSCTQVISDGSDGESSIYYSPRQLCKLAASASHVRKVTGASHPASSAGKAAQRRAAPSKASSVLLKSDGESRLASSAGKAARRQAAPSKASSVLLKRKRSDGESRLASSAGKAARCRAAPSKASSVPARNRAAPMKQGQAMCQCTGNCYPRLPRGEMVYGQTGCCPGRNGGCPNKVKLPLPSGTKKVLCSHCMCAVPECCRPRRLSAVCCIHVKLAKKHRRLEGWKAS
jgi:hypothetical protein